MKMHASFVFCRLIQGVNLFKLLLEHLRICGRFIALINLTDFNEFINRTERYSCSYNNIFFCRIKRHLDSYFLSHFMFSSPT